jgi:nicotinate phosphoribosyltransferase
MDKNINNNLKQNIISPLLTDFYQFTMIYAHWKNGKNKEPAVFDLFYRADPFQQNVLLYFI